MFSRNGDETKFREIVSGSEMAARAPHILWRRLKKVRGLVPLSPVLGGEGNQSSHLFQPSLAGVEIISIIAHRASTHIQIRRNTNAPVDAECRRGDQDGRPGHVGYAVVLFADLQAKSLHAAFRV